MFNKSFHNLINAKRKIEYINFKIEEIIKSNHSDWKTSLEEILALI